ncbi:MAG: SGNH/GDSL hydrolase family protein [Ruminococcaceae bacterium]|nr:SGNH/GDSL hydrolase family protein [Oscillospiraceae bacterium]
MDIKGKKINFLGDSITEGAKVEDKSNIYHARLAKEYGITARNYGIGGTRISRQSTPSQYPVHDRDFIQRVDEMDSDADIIVVFGGTNDFGHGDATLGQMTDRTPYTFYGACHTLCEKLIEKYPEALIVFMTPLHRCNEDNPRGDGYMPERGVLKEYVEIIKEVTEYYSIPTLDLWSCSSIQPKNPIIKEKYCPDGLHPNDAGHAIIASRLAGFLASL